MSHTADLKSVWISCGPQLDIDETVLQLWLQGYKVEEAAARRNDCKGYPRSLVESDTRDSFDFLASIEPYLRSPTSLFRQPLFALSERSLEQIIVSYYSYDDSVMSEILSSPLSRSSRKDLDEVAEKTGVSLQSCRRQFANLRRIFKAVEPSHGDIVRLIEQEFRLHVALARQYAAMVFIADNKLAIQKKVLASIPLTCFLTCAQAMFSRWTSDTMQLDLDKTFLMTCRDLRSLASERNSNLRSRLATQMPSEVLDALMSVFTLAAGFSHTRDWRDVFEDVMHQVVLVLRNNGVGSSDAKALLDALEDAFEGSKLTEVQVSVLHKLIEGMQVVIVSLMNSLRST
eukprot:TRINITY_DN6221_c0_g1_i1.p1 TRINITY_DN6221_c0_g1~~TRINITY_DN6221_c0_g1_i1.p1  ORF type:complete len:344 (+),score=51.39 TRINITY_DN6221_c0_g1_i1:1425-2456(+)